MNMFEVICRNDDDDMDNFIDTICDELSDRA